MPDTNTAPATAISMAELAEMVKAAAPKAEDIAEVCAKIVKEYTIVNRTDVPAAAKSINWNVGDVALAAKRKFYNRHNELDDRLKKDVSIGDDAQAGFLLPINMESEIKSYGSDVAIVRPRAQKRTLTQGDTTTLRTFKDSTRTIAAGMHGGVICYWGAEAGTMSESNIKAERINFKVEKLYAYLEDSNEFEADLPGANGWIGKALAEAQARYEDYYFLLGTGVGQPLGAFAGGPAYSVSRSVGAHFNLADAFAMYAKLLQPYDPSSTCWLMNPNVLPDLGTLESSAGFPIWQPDMTGKSPGTLLGIPIIFTPLIPTLGTAKDVCLGDFSHYVIVDRAGMRLEYDKSYLFKTDQTAYKLVSRVDGKADMSTYITSDNSVYYSPFVYLT